MIKPAILMICIQSYFLANLFLPSIRHEYPPVDEDKSYGSEYFPLKKNVLYKFDSNLGETTGKITNKGNIYTFAYEASNMSYKQSMISNAKGVYLVRTESKAFMFENIITYSKPLLRVPFPLEIGKTWNWQGYEVNDGDSVALSVKGQVLREETVETKMGKLKCVAVALEINSEKGSYAKMTEWLAPNIGIVKLEAKVKGGGITGFLQRMMGLDEIYFHLTEIKEL